jgi:hypothetical protein
MGIFSKRLKEARTRVREVSEPSGSPLGTPAPPEPSAPVVPPDGRDPYASPEEVAWRVGLWFRVETVTRPTTDKYAGGDLRITYSAGRDHVTYKDRQHLYATTVDGFDHIMHLLASCAVHAAEDLETTGGQVSRQLLGNRMEQQPDGTWKHHDPAHGVGL